VCNFCEYSKSAPVANTMCVMIVTKLKHTNSDLYFVRLQLLRAMCLGCHRLRASVTVNCLFVHQMTALDCEFLSVHTELEHIYRDLVKPADMFDDDEQKPTKLAAIFDSKLYDELNEKLSECVSSALKGKRCPCYY